VADPAPQAPDSGSDTEASLVLEQHFAIVPEWIIDAQISDCAYRLYSVLLRYGQTSGQRMPARATLAARLHKASKDTVDRALEELVGVGALVVERRRRDGRNLTNRYVLMTSPPEACDQSAQGGGRKSAATPQGRIRAARPRISYRKAPTTTAPAGLAGCARRASDRSWRARRRHTRRTARRRQ